MAARTKPLATPSNPVPISSDTVIAGSPIPALDRIKLFSSKEWEDFVLEWADSLRSRYSQVERCGGSGDMGRDVIAFDLSNPGIWDNYQCKHYDHALVPTDIWIELAKVTYYTQQGEYTLPRTYTFVAPQGAGTKLSNLLRNPKALRQGVKDNWETHCRKSITTTREIKLEGDLLQHLDSMDFSIFSAIAPLRLVDAHARTRWHVARFGGGLPPRPEVSLPPPVPDESEAGYIEQLWDAYSDHLDLAVGCVEDLGNRRDLVEHLNDSRVEFFSAEALRSFSRDTLPPGEFEKLQTEIHDGIRDEERAPHSDGYARALAVVKTARLLQLTNNPLVTKVAVRDRGGICHQLANDGLVRWVRRK